MKMTRGISPVYWALLHMLDDGQMASIDETFRHIAEGDVVQWLARLAGEWESQTGTLALVLNDPESLASVQDFLDRHENAVRPADVAVNHNGLCLLLGYCLNELQGAFE